MPSISSGLIPNSQPPIRMRISDPSPSRMPPPNGKPPPPGPGVPVRSSTFSLSRMSPQRMICSSCVAMSGLQRPVEKGKAYIHPVIDRRMIVVELLINLFDACLGEAFRQDARAVMQIILIAPAAIDVDEPQRLEIGLVRGNHVDRIV